VNILTKKKRIGLSIVSLSLSAVLALPLAVGTPTANATSGKLSPHTPVSSDGTIFEAAKTFSGVVTEANGSYVKGYEGTGKKSPVKIKGGKVAPVRSAEGNEGDVSTESVIGTDERTRVTTTTTYPYRAIAHIESDIGGCTGWMIDADTVATAGHCIYDPGSGRWASWAKVYPGRNGSTAPYGYANAVNFFSVTGWTQNGDTNYDYGAIKLDKPIGDSTGWFGLRVVSGSLNGMAQNISGYPGDKTYGTQWEDADQVRETYTYKVHYANDTYGGQSGSPVYNSSSCGTCSIAIHTNGVYGGNPYNRGTRITQEVFNNLNTWKNR
jgi:glutamyl endopeptidase